MKKNLKFIERLTQELDLLEKLIDTEELEGWAQNIATLVTENVLNLDVEGDWDNLDWTGGDTYQFDFDSNIGVYTWNPATSNYDVSSGGSQGCGQSMIVGPEGEIIHEASIGEELMLIEVDFDKVRRVRERGVKGLGQPLKSFRDNENISKIMNNINKEEYLSTLGKLKLPKKEKK